MISPFIIKFTYLFFTYLVGLFSMSILLPLFVIFDVFDTLNAIGVYRALPWKSTLFTHFCSCAWCTGHNGSNSQGQKQNATLAKYYKTVQCNGVTVPFQHAFLLHSLIWPSSYMFHNEGALVRVIFHQYTRVQRCAIMNVEAFHDVLKGLVVGWSLCKPKKDVHQ